MADSSIINNGVDIKSLERSGSQYYSKIVCLVQKMGRTMTFFGTTVNEAVRVHHLQKMKVQLKNHWMNFLIK
jgi:hypothetical protein